MEECNDSILNVNKEKNKLIEELNDITLKLNNEKKAHSETQNEKSLLNKKLKNAEGFIIIVKNIQEERDGLLRKLNDARSDHQILINQAQTARDEMHARFREFELKEKLYVDQISTLTKKGFQFEEKSQNQAKTINGTNHFLITLYYNY